MKNTRIFALGIFSLFLALFLISAVNAQTLIAGKIYNSDFSDTIQGADISITCNSYSLDTNTLSDGTYAVRFEEEECNKDDIVIVSATKSGYQEKKDSGIVTKCEGEDCEENYIMIINLGMKTQTSGGNTGGNSGGKNRYYLCGNGICNSGENENTCPKDCKETEPLTETLSIQSNQENEQETETGESSSENTGTSSGITGAVIGGIIDNGKIVIAFLFIILLLVASFLVYKFKIKPKKEEQIDIQTI